MSRSLRKTACGGFTKSMSEKYDKQLANRRYRATVKEAIHHNREMPKVRELSNVWDFNKDGKTWFGEMQYDPDEYWRKEYFKMMRK